MSLRNGRNAAGRRSKPTPKATEPVVATVDIAPGQFRVPFAVMVLRPGKLVGSKGEMIKAHMKCPDDVQALANAIVAGQFVCDPIAFAAQLSNGIAASAFALVDTKPELQSVADQGKESDRGEEESKEEGKEEGSKAEGGDGAGEEDAGEKKQGPQGLVT